MSRRVYVVFVRRAELAKPDLTPNLKFARMVVLGQLTSLMWFKLASLAQLLRAPQMEDNENFTVRPDIDRPRLNCTYFKKK